MGVSLSKFTAYYQFNFSHPIFLRRNTLLSVTTKSPTPSTARARSAATTRRTASPTRTAITGPWAMLLAACWTPTLKRFRSTETARTCKYNFRPNYVIKLF